MKNLHAVLTGTLPQRRPIWFMRQAGRWLPEYRALRQKETDFVRFCLTPELAIEATLQPLRRLDLDAAIVFADILLVPFALGQDVAFVKEAGPVLSPVRTLANVASLQWDAKRVAPVGETLRGLKRALQSHQTLIGFAGSPWTVACYMIDGRGKTGFPTACHMAETNDPILDKVIEILEAATLEYLQMQTAAGAEVIQLFESWGGLLTNNDAAFDRYVIAPTARIVRAFNNQHPTLPIIGFPRGVRLHHYQRYQQKTGISGLSVDQNTSLVELKSFLGNTCVLQGNLDPHVLVTGGHALDAEIDAILAAMPIGQTRHVFNLGHGVLPETPIEHMEQTVARVRKAD